MAYLQDITMYPHFARYKQTQKPHEETARTNVLAVASDILLVLATAGCLVNITQIMCKNFTGSDSTRPPNETNSP